MLKVIIGIQWGDEGKGKVVDYYSEDADAVCRFQGGNNAGHTIVISNKKHKLRLIPSGIFHEKPRCILGNGMVLDLDVLLEELEMLNSLGIDLNRVVISDKAHIILPTHVHIDSTHEDDHEGTDNFIGTTKRGIGPAYKDKAARRGIRIMDLKDPDLLREKVAYHLAESSHRLDGSWNVTKLTRYLLDRYQGFNNLVTNTSKLVNSMLDDNKNIIAEGAQGTFLDVDHGEYPYVTSSNTVAGAVCAGLGIGPTRVDEVVGVFKAYVTRVGAGPFPTEMPGNIGDEVVESGNEYGTVTGRKRKVGWLDLNQIIEAVQLNHISTLVMTKLDVFDTIPKLEFRMGKVNFSVKGWNAPTSNVKNYNDLPEEAWRYVNDINEFLGGKITAVCNGERRDQFIVIR